LRADAFSEEEIKIDLPGGRSISGSYICADPEKPTCVLVAGSGRANRNGVLASNTGPLRDLAINLKNKGIGSLRFDKSQLNSSSGRQYDCSIELVGKEIKECICFLENSKAICINHIGIIGHSEGGLAALEVALVNKVAFVITLNSPGLDGEEFIKNQIVITATNQKSTQNEIDNELKFIDRVFFLIKNGQSRQKIRQNLESLEFPIARDPWGWSTLYKEKLFDFYTSDEYRSLVQFRTTSIIKHVECPILAIYSSEDTQVDPVANLKSFENSFLNKQSSKTLIVENAGHFLANRVSDKAIDQKSILLWKNCTLNHNVVDVIISWLGKVSF